MYFVNTTQRDSRRQLRKKRTVDNEEKPKRKPGRPRLSDGEKKPPKEYPQLLYRPPADLADWLIDQGRLEGEPGGRQAYISRLIAEDQVGGLKEKLSSWIDRREDSLRLTAADREWIADLRAFLEKL